jgi:hypothetical protein
MIRPSIQAISWWPLGAAVAVRRQATVAAALAGPVTQGVALVGTLFFAGTGSPWPVPATPAWSGAQRSWLPALALTAAVLLVANREIRAAAPTRHLSGGWRVWQRNDRSTAVGTHRRRRLD